ncbi:MAG: PAS domain-containing protein [Helicobacteraceae bacterium]|jgi:aerotaxis receptor|nr:PAS domain-containing protein [Helicobacteraceae bacterium]
MVLVDEKTLLISETDRYGNIRYVNDEMCRVSGFQEAELLGRTHKLIRHSDMPKSVFKQLWETISRGATWRGFIKNTTKSGESFWVFTTIFPIESAYGEGFLAVRNRANEDEINRYEKRYEQLRKEEES